MSRDFITRMKDYETKRLNDRLKELEYDKYLNKIENDQKNLARLQRENADLKTEIDRLKRKYEPKLTYCDRCHRDHDELWDQSDCEGSDQD